MTEVTFRSDSTVELIQYVGDDQGVVRAARVSTVGAKSVDSQESGGLINYLMRERHGSVFEHNSFTFLIQTPLFVMREIMRHRIASYNEWSGRYSLLEPVFYVPARHRPLKQVGKVGQYTFEQADELWEDVNDQQRNQTRAAWKIYEQQLANGVAKEVARMVLPVSIYTSAYVTMNARGLMNFLSLRTASNALYEIQEVARKMEELWAPLMPLTHGSFNNFGRIVP